MKSSHSSSLFLPAITLLIISCSLTLQAQLNSNEQSGTSSPADPKELLLLALNSAGGQARISQIDDFVAHGQITYSASGANSKSGRVTLRGHGEDQFRMDSEFASGETTAWSVSNHSGQYKSLTGRKLGSIPFYNAINEGWLSLPYMRLASALSDSSAEFQYLGIRLLHGISAHRIRIIRHFPKDQDPEDLLSGLRTADYFLSTADLKIIGISDSIHPTRAAVGIDSTGHVHTLDIPRTVYYSDFRIVNGILVPFSVAEVVKGQPLWALQLNNITFNGGHNDSDFKLR